MNRSTCYLEAKAGNPAAILALSAQQKNRAWQHEPDAFHSRALRWFDGQDGITERPVGTPILLDNPHAKGVFAWVRAEHSFFEVGESAIKFQDSAAGVLHALEKTLGIQKIGLKPRIFLPPGIDPATVDGKSHSLPVLLAWLEYRLQLYPARNQRDAAGRWIGTGGWDRWKNCFKPVCASGLVRKAMLALSSGYDTLLVIRGQEGLEELPEGIEIKEVPADPAEAVRHLLGSEALKECAGRITSPTNHLTTVKNLWLHDNATVRNMDLPATVAFLADPTTGAQKEARALAASLLSLHATHMGKSLEAFQRLQEVLDLLPGCSFSCIETARWFRVQFPSEYAVLLTDLGNWDHEAWQALQETHDEILRHCHRSPWDSPMQFDLLALGNSLSFRPLFRSRLETGEKARQSLLEAGQYRLQLQGQFEGIYRYLLGAGRLDSPPIRQRNYLAEVAWLARKSGQVELVENCLKACTELDLLQKKLDIDRSPGDQGFDLLGAWTIATLEDRLDDADVCPE